MIVGAHAIVFGEDAEAARAFFDEVLELRSVDAGGGWLIFALPPAELACHPAETESGRYDLYLMCDDLEATMTDLRAKGVEFVAPVSDERWGRVTRLRVPGAGTIGLYEPAHPTAIAAE
jgi:catechol 2,3-dioxygenase-like lactoylglutathione lyase family enzyme